MSVTIKRRRYKLKLRNSNSRKSTFTLEAEWSQRYDFYDRGPLRATNHAKAAKQLVGQPIKGFEVVNNNYLPNNGAWKIHELWNDAEGQFVIPPLTRLLTMDNQNELAWIRDGIQAGQPTYIVYIVKDISGWQEGLDRSEIERLARLANTEKPNCQLIVLFINRLNFILGLKRKAEAVALKEPSSASFNLVQRALLF